MIKHGSYHIETIGQIVVSRLYSRWDLPTAQAYFKDMRKAVVQIYDKPWAHLANIAAWELTTPEVFEASELYNEWMVANGLRYKAVVTSSNVLVNLIKSQVHSSKFLDVDTFSDENSAGLWLQSKGFAF